MTPETKEQLNYSDRYVDKRFHLQLPEIRLWKQKSNDAGEQAKAWANPKRLRRTKLRLGRPATRDYHGNMGKVLSLRSLGPRFDSEPLHLLSRSQK